MSLEHFKPGDTERFWRHVDKTPTGENVLIGISFSAVNARKTHCPQNHPYNEANTYTTYLGYRRCRPCMAEQRRAERARARQSLPAAPTGEGS